MRVIELKRVKTYPADKETGNLQFDAEFNPSFHIWAYLSYPQVLREVLRIPLDRERGVENDEAERSMALLIELRNKQDGDILQIEDADYEMLNKKVQAWRPGYVSEYFIDLKKYVAGLEKLSPDEAAKFLKEKQDGLDRPTMITSKKKA